MSDLLDLVKKQIAAEEAARAEIARLKEIIDVAREALNNEGAKALGYVVDAFAGACDSEDTDAFSGVWGLCGRLVHAVRETLSKMPHETTEQKFAIKRYMMAVEAVLLAAVEAEGATPQYVNLLKAADQKMLDRHLRETADARRAERESCAAIADSYQKDGEYLVARCTEKEQSEKFYQRGWAKSAAKIAIRIRERSK